MVIGDKSRIIMPHFIQDIVNQNGRQNKVEHTEGKGDIEISGSFITFNAEFEVSIKRRVTAGCSGQIERRIHSILNLVRRTACRV